MPRPLTNEQGPGNRQASSPALDQRAIPWTSVVCRWSLVLLAALAGAGCVTSRSRYHWPVESFIEREGASEERIAFQEEAAKHGLYDFIPRHRSQVPWWAAGTWITWALLGNDDDGIFGERLQPPKPVTFGVFARWTMPGANFAHNFNGYVIGTAWRKEHAHFDVLLLDSREGVRVMRKAAPKVWGPGRWSLNLTCNDWLPFFGLRLGIVELGAGWKAHGGFGAAFRRAHVQPKAEPPPAAGRE